tara:strand:+ start:2204 stop:2677 length:474 start_codon:yes stop_codon:yes gene_type:complete
MDFGTTLTGLFLALVILISLLFISRHKANKRNDLLKKIQKLSQNTSTKLNKVEYGGNFAIAFSENNDYLYFVKNGQFSNNEAAIKLSEVKSCKLLSVKDYEHPNNFKSIKLIIKYLNKQNSTTEISLFNNEESFQLYDELLLGKRWETKINSHLQVS